MKIPFWNPKKRLTRISSPKPVELSEDEVRIGREIAYEKRLGAANPRLAKLRARIKNKRRKSYGT